MAESTSTANSGESDVNQEYTKSKKDKNGRFVNPWDTWKDPSIGKYIFKVLLRQPRAGAAIEDKAKLDKDLPICKPDFSQWQTEHPGGIRCMWIGHATVLVQLDGITFITDPQFSERASPIQWLMGAKRYRPPPCQVSDLPEVDAVFISHTHYDHLDVTTCRDLLSKFKRRIHWFVPLGLKSWMEQELRMETNGSGENSSRVIEMDWWEEKELNINGKQVKVSFTPAQHWCKRTALDDNKVLWGSWCVFGEQQHSFFFAGDTGYCEAFKQIGKRYKNFDLAAIPIGAYSPRWFMEPQHVDPHQAVLIHQDINAKYSVGIHWGTFLMTYEPYTEPREKLAEALEKLKVEDTAFITLKHGETKIFEV